MDNLYTLYKITNDNKYIYELLNILDNQNKDLFIKYAEEYLINKKYIIDNDIDYIIALKIAQYTDNNNDYSKAITFYNLANYYKPNHIAFNNIANIKKSSLLQEEAINDYLSGIETIRNKYNNFEGIYNSEVKNEYLTIISNLFMNFLYLDEDKYIYNTFKYKYLIDEINDFYKNKYIYNKNTVSKNKKIGIISSDFKAHPVGYIIESFFNHCSKDISIYCYDNSKQDIYSTFLKNYKNINWIDITNKTDTETINHIKENNIDILIDMMGFTSGFRPEILLAKPCKIVSYFAYPGTLLFEAIDYKIISQDLIHPDYTKYYTEKLLIHNIGLQCYKPPPTLQPAVKSFKNYDYKELSGRYFNICCYNNPQKFNKQIIKLFSKVLHKLPRSKLFFKYFLYNNIEIKNRIIKLFANEGIPETRLNFDYQLLIQGLESYNDMDIALDTFPYNGGMITNEALYMNTPVITLTGNLYHSRVGMSFYKTMELPELINYTEDEYINCAFNLYNNIDKLKWYHNNLREIMIKKNIINDKLFIKELENLLVNC